MRYYLIFLIQLACFSHLHSKDSIRVYVTGYNFNKETYKIRINGNEYQKKVSKGLDAFSFWVVVADSAKEGDILDVQIGIKRKFSFKYKYLQEDIFYQPTIGYCILERTHRRKRRHPLELKYQNSPFYMPQVKSDFWNRNIIFDRYRIIKVGND